MLILYNMSDVKLKLVEEEEPSELTNSVDRVETEPPINKVEPFSPSRFQHKWNDLSSLSVTEVGVNFPVRGSNIRQERDTES